MAEKDWYIVNSGKNIRGPFSVEEVREVRAKLPKGTYLIHNGVEPIHAHDDVGFEEIADFGYLLESPEGVTSVLPAPSSRVHAEVSNEFFSVATTDIALTKLGARNVPSKGKFEEFKTWFTKFLASKAKGGATTLFALAVLLPATSLTRTSPQNWIRTQLSAKKLESTPMGALRSAVSAKVSRNSANYAQALLSLETFRQTFNDNQLPPPSWTAAVALSALPTGEIENDPRWQVTLHNIKFSGKPAALASIATENKRIQDILLAYGQDVRNVGNDTKRKGSPMFAELWNGKNPRPVGVAMSVDAFTESRRALQKITSLSVNVPAAERVFSNRIVAQALWSQLQLTLLASSTLSRDILEKELQTISLMANQLPAVDNKIILLASGEVSNVLKNPPSMAQIAQNRLSLIRSLQAERRILCNPAQSPIAADFVVQTLHIARSVVSTATETLRQAMDECLVGANVYISSSPAELSLSIPMPLFIPKDFPSALTKAAFDAPKVENPINGAELSNAAVESLWRYFAGVDATEPQINTNLIKQMCRNAPSTNGICLNFSWHFAQFAHEKAALLKNLRKVFSSKDVRDAALSLATDVRSGALAVGSDAAPTTNEADIIGSISELIDKRTSDFAALEWHIQNGNQK